MRMVFFRNVMLCNAVENTVEKEENDWQQERELQGGVVMVMASMNRDFTLWRER